MKPVSEGLPPDQMKRELKKRLGEGIIIPAMEGIIICCANIEEYLQSKYVSGFVHQMPIMIHIKSGGAGNHEAYITKYLTLNETIVLRELLTQTIKSIQEADDVAAE